MRIGEREIAAGEPCFVIAEAGVNHNGDPELARRLIDVAAEAGVDAIKFQTFKAERLAALSASKAAYQERDGAAGESQVDMLRRLEISEAEHAPLKAYAEEHGLVFLSTPFDEDSADFLDSLGVAAFKVSSGEINNLPFLAHLANKARPLIISTGAARLDEVDVAVRTVREAGCSALALLHCVSCYPADPADANLRAMATMALEFGVAVGYSDHTAGTAVALGSVALGAAIVEKHFTLDRAMEGPDHAASLEPAELASLVSDLRAVESALGHGRKEPVPAELEIAQVARKSLHTRCELSAGARISAADLVALRPSGGVPPSEMHQVIGRIVTRDLPAGARLELGDLHLEIQ